MFKRHGDPHSLVRTLIGTPVEMIWIILQMAEEAGGAIPSPAVHWRFFVSVR
jgi:hypothetical protein